MSKADGPIRVELSRDEAMVLIDWLARTSDKGSPAPFVDAAEQQVLWNLECMLERTLAEPLSTAYASLLQAARQAVAGGEHRSE